MTIIGPVKSIVKGFRNVDDTYFAFNVFFMPEYKKAGDQNSCHSKKIVKIPINSTPHERDKKDRQMNVNSF